MSAEIQNMALSDEILKPHRSASTESVDIVQQPEVTEKEQVQARENALKYRAMRRLERSERNHRLAEEACQVVSELSPRASTFLSFILGRAMRCLSRTTMLPPRRVIMMRRTSGRRIQSFI